MVAAQNLLTCRLNWRILPSSIYGKAERAIRGRTGPGYPRHAHPQDARAKAHARIRHRAIDSANLRRSVARRRGLALSRAASPGARWHDRFRVGQIGQQSPREILPPERAGPETIAQGSE